MELHYIVCPNPQCGEFTLTGKMFTTYEYEGQITKSSLVKEWKLVPPSEAKTYPEYVPKPILDDYLEACLVKDLSPKASATLARRCLQGMVRDYWKIKKGHLSLEIQELEERVDPLVWKAIDAVRKVGNIGAHRKKTST